MSQIRAKQIKLVNEGDLIVGNGLGNGSIVSVGDVGQVLHVDGSSVAWEWTQSLYDPNGVLVLDTAISTGGVNYFVLEAGATGDGPTISVIGPDTNIDLNLAPVGLGEILAPLGYTNNIVSPNALTTKQYVDSVATGLDWKNSVVAATVSGDMTGFTYNVGNEPTGLVWTGVVAPVIDGVTLADGDRLIIKDAADERGNGIFVYDEANSAFVRADDADNDPNEEVSMGMAAFVEQGNVNASTAWVVTSPAGPAVLGNDDIIWTQFAGSQLFTAGDGLSLIGNEFNVNGSATIAINGANDVIVNSSNVADQVLLSNGTAGTQAVWGALDLGNSNSVTGELNVQNGGTGLTSVPEGHIVVGTGGSALATLAPTPASDDDTVYVLQTNAAGDNVLYDSIDLGQLFDVDTSGATGGWILVFNSASQTWVASSPDATDDKFVGITANDTAPGYLDDKLVVATSGALSKTTLNPGANESLELTVNYDDTTIIVVGNDLTVGGGLENQVLLGQGANAAAEWGYLNALYNEDGDELFVVEGSGNTLVYNATDGSLTQDGDLFINASGGTVYLNGVAFPSPVPENSILVATADDVLEPLTATGPNDQLLLFNASANAFEYIDAEEVGGFAYGIVELTGNVFGDVTLSADTTNDTLTLDAGVGITFTGASAANTVTVAFARDGMSDTPVTLTDTFAFFDGSNANAPEYRSFEDFLTDLQIPNGLSALGIPVQVSAGVWESREIVASLVGSELGIVVNDGDGINGNPTVGISIDGLVEETDIVTGDDFLMFYSVSAQTNYKVTVDSILAAAEVGTVGWDETVATGGANETFVGFFANTPISDASITVYFNGLALSSSGWTRAGDDLTLVDSVNGYATDAGDVIKAAYSY